MLGARLAKRVANDAIRSAGGSHVVAKREFKADEVLKYRREARAPCIDFERPDVFAVYLNSAFLRIVEPAQQLRDGRFACSILADYGERRTSRDGEIEVGKEGSAPSLAMLSSRRSTAFIGAAVPSNAQDNPPKAIMLVPMAAPAKVTKRASVRWPFNAPADIDQKTMRFAARTRRMLQTTERSRNRVASQRKSNKRRR